MGTAADRMRMVVPMGMAVVCLTLSVGGAWATTEAPAQPVGPVGTVDTVAGPGFCTGTSVIDTGSRSVRSLDVIAGVDGSPDRLFVDTGVPGRGLVGVVVAGGHGAALAHPERVVRLGTGQGHPWDAGTPLVPGLVGAYATLQPFGEVVATEREVILLAGTSDVAIAMAGDAAAPAASSGDKGPAEAARFTAIKALAGDEDGNVYLADQVAAGASTVRIRFYNRGARPVTFYPGTPDQLTVAPGAVDTIAGIGGTAAVERSNTGDGGPARQAPIAGDSFSLAVSGRRLYVASYWAPPGRPPESGVRMVNLGGEPVPVHGVAVGPAAIATVAGGAAAGFTGTGGPALAAAVSHVRGMAADAAGNVYLADEDNHRVRKVDPQGVMLNVAGTGGAGPAAGGFNGNDRAAQNARLDRPFDVKLGTRGRVYISDQGNGDVRYIDPAGVIRSAGASGLGLSWRCQDEGSTLRYGAPASVAAAGQGRLYLATPAMAQVKGLGASGEITTLAGNGRSSCSAAQPCPPAGGDGGQAGAARLQLPTVVVADHKGGVYVVDRPDHRVRYVNPGPHGLVVNGMTVAPGTIAGVAGDGTIGSRGDGGKAVAAQLSSPSSLALGRRGELFVAEPDQHRVRLVDGAGTITTFLGPHGTVDPADSGCCPAPTVLAGDRAGNLYVYDSGARQVFFVNRAARPVTVHGQAVKPGAVVAVAGNGKAGVGSDRGPALSSSFQGPAAMVADDAGNLYVADAAESTVRKIDAAGVITTAAGTGTRGFNGDGLKGPLTALSGASGVAFDTCGNLLVADPGNDRVRRLNLRGPCRASIGGAGTRPYRVAGPIIVALSLSAFAVIRFRPWRRFRSRAKQADRQDDLQLSSATSSPIRS